jgi:hypothetical protein
MGPAVIAYTLSNLGQKWALPKKINDALITGIQQRLVKTGGRRVIPTRYD